MATPRKRRFRLAGEPEFDQQGRRIRLKHPPEFKEMLVSRQDNLCGICGTEMGVVPEDAVDRRPALWMATYEHVVRFADGGADDDTNIVAAHRICNEKLADSYREPK